MNTKTVGSFLTGAVALFGAAFAVSPGAAKAGGWAGGHITWTCNSSICSKLACNASFTNCTVIKTISREEYDRIFVSNQQ